jgi:hypothetical protein
MLKEKVAFLQNKVVFSLLFESHFGGHVNSSFLLTHHVKHQDAERLSTYRRLLVVSH